MSNNSPDMPRAKKAIYDISPYVGGESASTGKAIKLSSNEGAFGPPPLAVQAMKDYANITHRYPDGSAAEIRKALAEKHKINSEQIVCGAGSDELISLLCRAYTGEGDEVLYSEHGFLMYAISAKVAGAIPVTAAEINLCADVDALLNAVTEKTKIVFLANPNNPTGSYIQRADVVRLHAGLPPHVLLVLDAAYAEYVDDPNFTAGHDLVAAYKNIVVLRTFSKLYALGGIRLGWAHCSDDVADVLNRARGPFNVSSIAQAAAIAALRDDSFVQKSLAHNKEYLTKTTEALVDMGLKVYASAGNFVLVDIGTAKTADQLRLSLNDQNIFVRQMGAYNLPSCLRITIGTAEEMNVALKAIKEAL